MPGDKRPEGQTITLVYPDRTADVGKRRITTVDQTTFLEYIRTRAETNPDQPLPDFLNSLPLPESPDKVS